MHFILSLTTLLATASALTLPTNHWRILPPIHSPRLPEGGLPREHIGISSYTLRSTNSTIQSVSFHISAFYSQNITCFTGAIPVLPSTITPCAGEDADSGFRFSLSETKVSNHTGAEEGAKEQKQKLYAVNIVHGKGSQAKWGRVAVPTYCHAGGMGPSDWACVQVPVNGTVGVTLRGYV